MMDLGCSLALVSLLVAIGVAYGVRMLARGEVHFARVDANGSSPLLGRRPMEMAYWSLQPVARLFIELGIGPNAITLGSMALALSAAVLLAFGHFGLAAVITAVASLGDALDGLVARTTGVASDAGEVFDAAVDRYFEGVFLGGLAIFYRGDVVMLVAVLAALLGSFMVSYATAKAEACHAEVPRGWMRRTERAVYLNSGITLAPIFAAFLPGDSAWWAKVPIFAAVAVVGFFGNVSAIRRLRALAHSLRARDAAKISRLHAAPSNDRAAAAAPAPSDHERPPEISDTETTTTSGIRSSVTSAPSTSAASTSAAS